MYIALNHVEHDFERSTLWWSLVATTAVVAALYAVVWNYGHWKHKKIR